MLEKTPIAIKQNPIYMPNSRILHAKLLQL